MIRSRVERSSNIWPGFVDALATLLLVIMFLLTVFILGYFFISQALSGREEALDRLGRQVNELAELLALERQANADQRLNVAQLSASLQTSTGERDRLALKVDSLSARADRAESALAEAQKSIAVDRETIELQLSEIESLRRDVASLREVRDALEAEVGQLAAARKESEQEIGALRDRGKELEARLAGEQERTLLAQKEIEKREVRLEELVAL